MATKPSSPNPKPKGKARTNADWERVEIDYRAGFKTLRMMADEHDITEGAIRKRAKVNGWVRDIAAKVNAKASELVRKAEVEVRKAEIEVRNKEKGLKELTGKAMEAHQIEVSATIQATVLLEHRHDIKRGRKLFQGLLAEVEAQTGNPQLFAQLAELMGGDGDEDAGRSRADKLTEIYKRVISTPGRVESAKKLIEMLEKVVRMEREAFKLDNEPPPDPSQNAAAALQDAAYRYVGFKTKLDAIMGDSDAAPA